MTSHRLPVIGVTANYNYADNLLTIKNGYYEGVIEAGGLPVMLPFTEDEELVDQMANQFDGFLFSGGPDLYPGYYNEYNLSCNGEISPYRDSLEISLIQKAFAMGKPIFGICRGCQVINVALGGSLYQDIYTQAKMDPVILHSQKAPRWFPSHDIHIEAGSRVWESFGKDYARVNSYHHQAIKDVAPGFSATSKSPDGIIESIEHPAHKFAVGVQWHPECMWRENSLYLNLFTAFINSCKAE